jgi:hypothetical protein
VEHDQVKLQYTAAVIQVPMAAAHMLQLAAILQLFTLDGIERKRDDVSGMSG